MACWGLCLLWSFPACFFSVSVSLLSSLSTCLFVPSYCFFRRAQRLVISCLLAVGPRSNLPAFCLSEWRVAEPPPHSHLGALGLL